MGFIVKNTMTWYNDRDISTLNISLCRTMFFSVSAHTMNLQVTSSFEFGYLKVSIAVYYIHAARTVHTTYPHPRLHECPCELEVAGHPKSRLLALRRAKQETGGISHLVSRAPYNGKVRILSQSTGALAYKCAASRGECTMASRCYMA